MMLVFPSLAQRAQDRREVDARVLKAAGAEREAAAAGVRPTASGSGSTAGAMLADAGAADGVIEAADREVVAALVATAQFTPSSRDSCPLRPRR